MAKHFLWLLLRVDSLEWVEVVFVLNQCISVSECNDVFNISLTATIIKTTNISYVIGSGVYLMCVIIYFLEFKEGP